MNRNQFDKSGRQHHEGNTSMAPQVHWKRIIASLFTKKRVLRTAAAAFVLSGSLLVGSSLVLAGTSGTPGVQGTAGSNAAIQQVTINNSTTQTHVDGLTWGKAGLTGGVGGEAGEPNPAFGPGEEGDGDDAAAGGRGGTSGKSGKLDVKIEGGNLNFGATRYGAQGAKGAMGGKGGHGADGGEYLTGIYPAFVSTLDGGKGGAGGVGGNGADGAGGGEAVFTISNGASNFAANSIFGGFGGIGGQGGEGGDAGFGGNGGDGIAENTVGIPGAPKYPALPPGNGGKGGDGGVGGNGGLGGNGGDTTFTISGGTTNFTSAQFGGDGGKGGDGGDGEIGGVGGTAGGKGTYPDAYTATVGAPGARANGGKGGNGGNGGKGAITITGGTVVFAGNTVFGGKAGDGGAGGQGAVAGGNGSAGVVGNGSSLTISGGNVTVGNMEFRGSGNAVKVGTGNASTYDALQLNYEGNTTIDLGENSTFTVDGGLTLNRSLADGVLTIDATYITSSNNGKIRLNVLGEGEFLTFDGAVTGLTLDSFDTNGYLGGAEVSLVGNTFSVTFLEDASTLTWTGAGDKNWEIGESKGGGNWDGGTGDFYTRDTAVFTQDASSMDVTLVGDVTPGNVLVQSGSYTFNGDGALVVGDVTVGTGTTNATLTFANTGENTYGKTTVMSASTVNAGQANSLGSGTVSNAGVVNYTSATGGSVNNVFTGEGALNLNGGGDFTFTADSTATGQMNITNGSTVTFVGTYAGNIASENDVTVDRDTDWNYARVLSGAGGLVKEGDGVLTLSGTNTFQGGTTINGGTVIVANAAALGAPSGGNMTTISDGGTLDVNGYRQIGSIGVELNDGGTLLNNGNEAVTMSAVTVDAAVGAALGGSGDMTFSNDLGNGKLDKIGAGTVTFTKANAGISETTVSAGTLVLSGEAGDADVDFVAGEKGRILINRGGALASNFQSAGVDAEGVGYGKLEIAAGNTPNSFNNGLNFGGRTTVAEGAQIENTDIVVGAGAVMEVTASLTEEDAAIQGGTLTLENGSKFVTNLVDYDIKAGQETNVYVANGLTDTADIDSGAKLDTFQQRLLYNVGSMEEKNGSLYYVVKRRFGADVFPRLSSTIGPVIDAYVDGNSYFELLLNLDEEAEAEALLQSGFDIVSLSNAMSATYEAKLAINRALDARALDGHRGPDGCSPCGAASKGKREVWASLLYENAKGFRLKSGGFRYGYTNDMYGGAFGVDRTNGNTRLGLMGVGGWGKTVSSGGTARTRNETSFGGVYGYASQRLNWADLFISGGWLGMESDISQVTYDRDLKGDMDSGLASFSVSLAKTLCFDGLHVTPSIGFEYGYYYQKAMDVKWGADRIFQNEKANANICVLPVGVHLTRNMNVRGGKLTPELRARYIANIGDVATGYKTWTTGSPASALLGSSMTDRHAGELGVSMGWTRGNVTLTGDYGYMFSKHHQNQFVSLSGVWKF